MTPAQQPQEYEFACNCCENKCRVIAYNAIPPDCGCIINSDCGAIWSARQHTPAPNLSCLGQYERDPCLIPACPIKAKCREYTSLRQAGEQ